MTLRYRTFQKIYKNLVNFSEKNTQIVVLFCRKLLKIIFRRNFKGNLRKFTRNFKELWKSFAENLLILGKYQKEFW